MGVTFLNKPNRNCLRHIVSAQGLLLCRDESYRVSPHKFALLFSQLCDEVSKYENGIRSLVPTRNEIEKNPLALTKFLVSRALETWELCQVPKELLYALAQSYLTVGFEDDLTDVGAFIRSCLNGIPQNVVVTPIGDSCKVATIDYFKPSRNCFGKEIDRAKLVIEEQCDFKIKEEHTRHEDYPRVRLRVRYRVERSKKLETLYHLSVRKVGIELVHGTQESLDHILSRCSWDNAYKQIKKFYVSRIGLRSAEPLFSMSRWRLQPRNEVYITHKVVWRATSIKDLVKTLLSVLSGIADGKLRLTHGRTQVRRLDKVMDQCYSEMYSVKHCAVLRQYGVVCGVDVRCTIYQRRPWENVRLFGAEAYFMRLRTRDFVQYIKFLCGDLCSYMDNCVLTTDPEKAVTCRRELLEDAKRLLGYSVGKCDFENLLSVAPSSNLTVSHIPEAVHHERGGAYSALKVRSYMYGQCSCVNV
ncbi:hypothetical protein [Candidatus Anaplasma sp. TIGMIC]|uniref:hypothetical protein n=1 Tax=Candidatus Anaplasma sp. TIGMIC TaxID=3020713 RepID=UPI00232B35F5|nr:hypothetical protein [Candidatus Anaplasma sp. TIGMIC]MDB1135558.1 hypothetical protein [Candidatus Anaplasma sp. TIGMIC]